MANYLPYSQIHSKRLIDKKFPLPWWEGIKGRGNIKYYGIFGWELEGRVT